MVEKTMRVEGLDVTVKWHPTRAGTVRCCETCRHFVPRIAIISGFLTEQQFHELTDDDLAETKKELEANVNVRGLCYEGGFSEIGDPTRVLTEEDCNAWEVRQGA